MMVGSRLSISDNRFEERRIARPLGVQTMSFILKCLQFGAEPLHSVDCVGIRQGMRDVG